MTERPIDPTNRNPDAIHHPRLTIVGRKLAHVRAVVRALGWPGSLWSLASPWQPRPWAPQGQLSALRVLVSDDLVVGRCADGADFVLSVETRGKGQPLWLEITGCEHEPRSGLMRRLRAGIRGPRWA